MKMPPLLAFAAALSTLAPVSAAADPATPTDHAGVVRAIAARPQVKAAIAELDRTHDQWVADIIALAEIPSPPFKESARARAYAERFRAAGLADVEIDAEGNVTGLRKGTGGGSGKLVVVSAHMDTVFPEGTPIKVRREGDRLFAPGVGDDSAGLATQLSLIGAIEKVGIRTPDDILFVGTVGEEGLGDLRGVRYLFNKGRYAGRIGAFFSIDGTSSAEFTIGGVGSKRYRVTFTGPGGHSFGAFGLVNPLSALSQSVVNLYRIPVPASPKTTYSASVVGGGTSVNAIPREVWLEVDMRSESADALAEVERGFLAGVRDAVDAENAARSTKEGPVKADLKLVGDRPAGATAKDSDIVRFAAAAYTAAGIVPEYGAGSTDSNVAMSLGIPAITIARAAEGGRGHSLDEWIGVAREPAVRIRRLDLVTILAVAGYR
ncbi:M20/M25/M40 family metallo-hydrolase [Sphingomonas sp. dw_22]|uniref:M20/M25/M40 family metallo-hydrolase n=1 Tax=Sphingomonas sp. dw_22 TaxID=2721175 RepID=UPI001BD1CD8D|nr:M20/M25/M40 family metallo-hydrolase [Sphingomonas sp. dw_22]